MSLLIGNVADAVAAGRRRRFDEGEFHGIADYLFETAQGEDPGPQALIARQAPGWTLPVHFHMQHQFQVVLRGNGTLGKHALAPGSVHYTSPQSAYGPIVAGDEGLDYFTLRALTDKGAWYMPQSRPFMQLGMSKEQKWGRFNERAVESGTIIPLSEDGSGAWSLRAHSGQSVECDSPNSEAGRFHLVLRGAFRLDDERELPVESCIYCTEPQLLRFTAIEPDSLLVVVQFPHQAVHHHVPPELRIAPSARGTAVLPQ